MAWYDDRNRQTYIGTYKSEKDARNDLEQAVRRGWKLEDTTKDGGHMNVGRTVTGASLTLGASLLFGGSRDKGSLTLVFVRHPATVARGELEAALTALKPLNDRALKANQEVERAGRAFRDKATPLLASEALLRDRGEKDVREALEELIKRRAEAHKARGELIASASAANHRRGAAQALGAIVTSPYLAVLDQIPNLDAEQRGDAAFASVSQPALDKQRATERAAHDYGNRYARHVDCGKRVEAARRQTEVAGAAIEDASADKIENIRKKLADAVRELQKRSAEAAGAENELVASEQPLRAAMRLRNLAFEPLL